MFDPISVFYCMWVLNSGLPDARLKVQDVVKDKENKPIVETVALRKGV